MKHCNTNQHTTLGDGGDIQCQTQTSRIRETLVQDNPNPHFPCFVAINRLPPPPPACTLTTRDGAGTGSGKGGGEVQTSRRENVQNNSNPHSSWSIAILCPPGVRTTVPLSLRPGRVRRGEWGGRGGVTVIHTARRKKRAGQVQFFTVHTALQSSTTPVTNRHWTTKPCTLASRVGRRNVQDKPIPAIRAVMRRRSRRFLVHPYQYFNPGESVINS